MSFQGKEKNFSFHIVGNKQVQVAVVVMGIKLSGKDGSWVLDCLKARIPLYKTGAAIVHEVCAMYATFYAMRAKIMKGGFEEIKNKVSGMNCAVHDDEFVITLVCAPNLTAARKNAGLMVKYLNVDKVAGLYAEFMKVLDLKGRREEYEYVADTLSKSIKDKVEIVVTGKLGSVDKEKADGFFKMVSGKMPDLSTGKGSKPEKLEVVAGEHPFTHHHLSAPGVEGLLLKKYLESGNVDCVLSGGKIYFGNEKHLKMAQKMADVARIKRFVGDKLKKFVDVKAVLIYLAAVNGATTTKDLIGASSVTSGDLAKYMEKHLK
ncbi:hypothetical protein BNJ_00045 [Kaumoebavirus]|uniref:hypothetical protein n=1 Tax=Kaumoebavirus TaxID=1859492 RepID=UPI0009C30502|nr:hypothetical protein BNJ_00045 [Kaumoebavirus]ARA71888.1 hypothetical protein BNJ_00045 [Kaumoebavirus]